MRALVCTVRTYFLHFHLFDFGWRFWRRNFVNSNQRKHATKLLTIHILNISDVVIFFLQKFYMYNPNARTCQVTLKQNRPGISLWNWLKTLFGKFNLMGTTHNKILILKFLKSYIKFKRALNTGTDEAVSVKKNFRQFGRQKKIRSTEKRAFW